MTDRQKVEALENFRANLWEPTKKDFRRALANCRKCQNLRRPVVVGQGNYENPKLAIYGEAPGKEEHEGAEPFIGRAGKLLRSILSELNIDEKDIWISNAVRCWPAPPPDSDKWQRTPKPEEVANCRPWLAAELELLNPRLVLLLGSTPLKAVFGDKKITKERGKVFRVGAYAFMPTFHPAYILRNMSKKIEFEEDLRRAAELIKQ